MWAGHPKKTLGGLRSIGLNFGELFLSDRDFVEFPPPAAAGSAPVTAAESQNRHLGLAAPAARASVVAYLRHRAISI